MTYEERAKVYDQALETFGQENQLIVALEELSECQKEICKALRGQLDLTNLAEEVADAIIMLEQVQRILSVDTVDWWMDRKVERLHLRILSTRAPMAWDEKTESGLLEE
jgi:hypothetical protein